MVASVVGFRVEGMGGGGKDTGKIYEMGFRNVGKDITVHD